MRSPQIFVISMAVVFGMLSACTGGTSKADTGRLVAPTSTQATVPTTTSAASTSVKTSATTASTIVANTQLCNTLLDIFSHAPKTTEADRDMVSLHNLKPTLPADQQSLAGQMETAYAVASSNSYGPFAAALNRLGTAANC